MKITEKLAAKASSPSKEPSVTIAFLGDSVTQGHFETYFDDEKMFDGSSYPDKAYPQRVREILNKLYPGAQVNIINSGVGGDNARMGLKRFDRDISPFHPDLTVVSFGLNDACSGKDYVTTYLSKLQTIFDKVKEIGSECIFMTENMMCNEVSPHITSTKEKELASFLAKTENDGLLEYFFENAKELANKNGVRVCDVYTSWKNMEKGGVKITRLLANRLNHPNFDFHYYFAIKLVEEMFK